MQDNAGKLLPAARKMQENAGSDMLEKCRKTLENYLHLTDPPFRKIVFFLKHGGT